MNAEPILEAETSISQLITDKDSTQNGVIIDEILQEINKNGAIAPGEPPNITITEEVPQMQQQQQQQQQQLEPQPTQMQQLEPQPTQMQQLEPQPTQMQQQQGAPVDFQHQNQNQEQIIYPQETTGLMDNIDSTEKTFENLKDNILDELKLPVIVPLLALVALKPVLVNVASGYFLTSKKSSPLKCLSRSA